MLYPKAQAATTNLPFSTSTYQTILNDLAAQAHLTAGKLIRMSYVPLILPASVKEELLMITNQYLTIINSEPFHQNVRTHVPDWLQETPFNPLHNGCFDFNLTPQGPKLIEYMATPTGMVAVMFKATAIYAHHFGLRTPYKNLDELYLTSYPLQKNIAIVDTNPPDQITYAEFLCLKDTWETKGKTVAIVDPHENLIAYDSLFHRVTGPEVETLDAYKHFCITHKEKIHPHPIQWYLGDKMGLTYLSHLSNTATTCHISKFTDWTNSRKYVFKPASGYGGKNILIQPQDAAHLKDKHYVVQEHTPPDTVTTPVGDMKYDIRVIVLSGKPSFFYARLYKGQQTNRDAEGSGFAPVYFLD